MTIIERTVGGAVSSVAAASPDQARSHFASRLAFETDVSDVHVDLAAGGADIVLVDVRSREAWDQGHAAGAVHCPHAEVPERGRDLVSPGLTAVVYCWGPGCNGATRAAWHFACLGLPVKEMIGGFEWWARQGLPVEGADGVHRGPVDPLTAVVPTDVAAVVTEE